MYSGTTFHSKSGRMAGVHQRIDRIARRSLTPLIHYSHWFPSIRSILHFEGMNGPDGIKRKSPGTDEPWHYIDPYDESDTLLLDMIDDHIENLSVALKQEDEARASFEAAWLAHAIVDGLTPAHHYPLEAKLMELRDGQGLETRNSRREKLVLPGKTRRHQLQNNWEYWGAKGIMTSHLGFELGVMTTLASSKITKITPHQRILKMVASHGYRQVFLRELRHIADLKMYEEFQAHGWTRREARRTREILVPRIAEMVLVSWLAAIQKVERIV